MTKQNFQSSLVSLNSIVDNLFKDFDFMFDNSHTVGYSSGSSFLPSLWTYIDNNSYNCPVISTPSYPVSSFYIDEEGNSIIEIACTGFGEDEIEISRKDLTLIVKGAKQDQEEVKRRKTFFNKIGQRNFTLEYQCSEKMDFEKLEAHLSKGILTITIPLKEESKPIRQTFKIKK